MISDTHALPRLPRVILTVRSENDFFFINSTQAGSFSEKSLSVEVHLCFHVSLLGKPVFESA